MQIGKIRVGLIAVAMRRSSTALHDAASWASAFGFAAAYAAPRRLTFGDSDRNSLRNPDYINFNMALFKHFVIKESTALEFRAEGFNVFNHTEWLPVAGNAGSGAGIDGSGNNTLGGTSFLYSGGVHQARILQFALKFLF